MILSKYIIKETLKVQFAVLLILILLFTAQQFIETLDSITKGQLPADIIISVLSLEMINMIQYILPLSIFLGILFTFSRFYINSEFTVMKASGVNLRLILKVVLILSVITGALGFANVFWLTPWSRYELNYVVTQAKHSHNLSVLKTNSFVKDKNGNNVIFITKSQDGTLENLFLFQNVYTNNPSILTANTGKIGSDTQGNEQLTLHNTTNYFASNANDFHVVNFRKYKLNINFGVITVNHSGIRELNLAQLLKSKSPLRYTELCWKLSLVLSIFIMAFLAIPLSKVNARSGRFGKMLPAVMLYTIYFLCATSFKHSGENSGRILFSVVGMLGTNLVFLALVWLLNLWDSDLVYKIRHRVKLIG